MLLLTLCFQGLSAEDAAKQTNNPARPVRTNENAILQHLTKVTGEDGKRFAKPEGVVADGKLQKKATDIKKVMKQMGNEKKTKAPQTLEEATDFLLGNLSLACFPTACFEYDGVFYFSGGTSIKPIDDFSSGFAIRKGESKIYTWSPSESKKEDGDKDKSK